jgi:hypothetical protein
MSWKNLQERKRAACGDTPINGKIAHRIARLSRWCRGIETTAAGPRELHGFGLEIVETRGGKTAGAALNLTTMSGNLRLSETWFRCLAASRTGLVVTHKVSPLSFHPAPQLPGL